MEPFYTSHWSESEYIDVLPLLFELFEIINSIIESQSFDLLLYIGMSEHVVIPLLSGSLHMKLSKSSG